MASAGAGNEPHVLDTSTGLSWQAKDVNVQTASANPRNLTVAGDLLYFNADNLAPGPGNWADFIFGSAFALWQTDGTVPGTAVVQSPQVEAYGNYRPLHAIGENLFIHTGSDYIADTLAITDGSTVTPVYSTAVAHKIVRPTFGDRTTADMNGILYFSANSHRSSEYPTYYGVELWRSDGTTNGTLMVKDIIPGAGSSNPEYLLPFGGRLYFRANDGTHGNELWRSEGTDSTTLMVKDINAGSADSFPRNFTAVGDTVMFTAYGGVTGRELWKTDGTENGTVRVKDIIPGSTSSDPDELAAQSSTCLLFTAKNAADAGRSLWRSDGSGAGTEEIFHFTNDGPISVTSVGSRVVFVASDPEHGDELWRSDGTTSGTGLAWDLNPGPAGSRPEEFTVVGDMLYFRTNTPAALWVYDSAANKARCLSEGWSVTLPMEQRAEMTYFKDRLYFIGDSEQNGRELWSIPVNDKAVVPGRAWQLYD